MGDKDRISRGRSRPEKKGTVRSQPEKKGTVRSRPKKKGTFRSQPDLYIIKIGGNIISNENALESFLSHFAKIAGPKILVHGGGKLATQLAEKMDVEVKMNEGRRITDNETLDIITMVYAGKINKNIVAKLQAHNCNSIGFTGADGNTIVSDLRPVKTIDYGFAGDIKEVNTELLEVLINNNVSPVFCAITHDNKGQLLNTNADTIASELAIAFSNKFKVNLMYCFEKIGVLRDINDDESIIEQINFRNYKKFKEQGIIADGMLPKLDNCFHAIHNGVKSVYIGNQEMIRDTKTKCTKLKA